eukprot:jgi/Tetstr1/462028/TSEL_007099.t1
MLQRPDKTTPSAIIITGSAAKSAHRADRDLPKGCGVCKPTIALSGGHPYAISMMEKPRWRPAPARKLSALS